MSGGNVVMSEGNGWTEWRNYVLESLRDTKASQGRLEKRLRNVELRLAFIVAGLMVALEIARHFFFAGGGP